MCVPSLIAHVFGVFVLITAIVVFFNNFRQITFKKPYNAVVVLLLFSGVITLHGVSHLGLEAVYKFNPLRLNF